MTTKGKPIFNAALRRKILRECRPEEQEEVEYMLQCMNQLLRLEESPEERESSQKQVAKTGRQLKEAKSA